MPTNLSPPGTRLAAGTASRKSHSRADCEDRSNPSEDASFGAREILVSGSGSHAANGAPSREWADRRFESSGNQSGRPKSRTHSRFGVRNTGAPGDFVDRVSA